MAISALPSRVEIVEVSPRDGLQNESRLVSTEQKLALIERLVAAGARRIEATSFVNPARVPQMADAEKLMETLRGRYSGVSFSGLVLNARGAQRAVAVGCQELTYVVVASETLSLRNQGRGVAEIVAGWGEIARIGRAAGLRCNVLIAAAFGCPFEGEVDAEKVLDLVSRVSEVGGDEIGLADTIGVATPVHVATLFSSVSRRVPGMPLRAHFHDTRNTGIANAVAALSVGVNILDASVGGIGGCPFAPRATGNVPAEDLVYTLDRMGVVTGFDGPALAEMDAWLADLLGHAVPGSLGKAGWFGKPGPQEVCSGG
ncbi:hydroxymethylglutaryl-CoA lyase [Leptospira interrogans]